MKSFIHLLTNRVEGCEDDGEELDGALELGTDELGWEVVPVRVSNCIKKS